MTERAYFPSRRHALGLIGATLLCPRTGWAQGLDGISGAAFGTGWRLVGPPVVDLMNIQPDIEALFATIDRQMSPWRPDSALSQFNAAPAGSQAAEAEIIHVAHHALTLANQSGGAFDPTVGPLVAQWGFGPIEGGATPNWRGLSAGNGRIGKTQGDLTFDLCGIAKGRALDLAVDLAAQANLGNLLFDLGGELKALGHHPSGRDWQIAVQHPLPDHAPTAMIRLPTGRAVATSGQRTQSYELGGRVYGHIIDPAARSPADTGLLTVTVLADEAMMADGWATALFAAGATDGPAQASDHAIDALFLVRDGASFRQIRTGAIEGILL